VINQEMTFDENRVRKIKNKKIVKEQRNCLVEKWL
jgi:hypothetical protein